MRGVPHVSGQHVGKPAHLAATHGVGLAGQRQRAGARLANTSRCQMAVDDGVDLVAALRRLVHTLRVAADDAFAARPPAVEGLNVGGGHACRARDRRDVSSVRTRHVERRLQPFGVAADVGPVDRLVLFKPEQQTIPELGVRARADREVEVGALAAGGAARVDRDDAHAAFRPRGLEALVEHGVAPGRVRSCQHDQVGQL